MCPTVYFWDHDHPEGGNDDSKSKVNPTEAEMAARLALYMVQQGYPAGEVTILTPYVGQLCLIRQAVGRRMGVIVGDADAEQLVKIVGRKSSMTDTDPTCTLYKTLCLPACLPDDAW